MAHNDFSGETGGYDPDEIMTSSQDRNGHSTNQRVHVPPSWRAMMEQYIQSDQWPEYRHMADIVRDALYHRLYWASQQKNRSQFPEVASAMVRERYRKRLDAEVLREMELREFRHDLDTRLTEMLQREEYEAVLSYCEDLLTDMSAFEGRGQEKLVNQIHTFIDRAKGRW